MATMPDRLWRRCIELFLVAGRIGKAGWIPEAKQLAWTLRIPADELDLDMKQLEIIGIIQRVINGWQVVNFTKRQAKIEDAERKRQQREREKQAEYYDGIQYSHDNVTDVSRNVTQINRLTETETETETESSPDPFFMMVATTVGIAPTANDITTMIKWEQQGVTEGDIKDALAWRITESKKPVKTIAQLDGSVDTARRKRIQSTNATSGKSLADQGYSYGGS